ncbi:MAG: GGDEF domain-containing protein, partial [Proteobacteria bacterium]|nr:GGDEF domain-containing protein [Pseudomonadota bacterium]MBU1966328.1 GGDEF domain-containing protein [Pseudomonadota bacterium]
IFSLQQLNEIAYRIINDDFAVVDQSKSLLDSLIAQESAEKRYLILQDPTIEEIFWSRSREFNRIFEELRKGRFAGLDPKIARLSLLHSEYDALFFQEVQLVQAKRNEEAQVLSEGQGRKAIDEMAMLVRAVQKKAEENIDARMKRIDVQSLRASRLTVVLSLVSLVLGVLVVLLVTYNISRPLRRLEQATTMIAEGKFDFDFHLDRNDEIGSLSYAFGIMAQRLKILEERNLDASPLTGLPGNLAIERELGNRLQAKRPVSLCHVDLDNFKPFVDHYGYAWGSEVIKEAALLLIAELKEAGKKGDFLGHIGGDDFVLISVPPRAEQICRRIVAGFDGRIRKFYTETDREQGFFIGKDRQGVRQKFPLISVTIAIVTDDGTRFQNPLAMAEVAAQLKEYAKTLPGNNCVTEKDVHKV